MTGQPDLTDRAVFQYWHRENIRFSDTDMIGHVNNVAFAALIESGRVAFTHNGMIKHVPKDSLVVMRHISLDYRAELHWPAEIEVGSCLMRVGGSSFAIGNGVFHGSLCAATSVTTLVVINRETRRPRAIDGEFRDSMMGYLRKQDWVE